MDETILMKHFKLHMDVLESRIKNILVDKHILHELEFFY